MHRFHYWYYAAARHLLDTQLAGWLAWLAEATDTHITRTSTTTTTTQKLFSELRRGLSDRAPEPWLHDSSNHSRTNSERVSGVPRTQHGMVSHQEKGRSW
jgi:hypothetical protein